MQLLKKHTPNPKITLLCKFHTQKALFKVPKICIINFWIENDPTPPNWNFSENSSDLVAPPFPNRQKRILISIIAFPCHSLNDLLTHFY